MQAEIILYLIIFLYGIVIGSFLNVLIYRIPLKENIATERSHCMSCGSQIKWYDLIPLVSYIILRGRCRNCGSKISIQYPLVEGLNGCGYVLIAMVNGLSWLCILDCLLLSILIVVSVIDYKTYEIPISLNIAILILAVIRTILDTGHVLDHLAGGLIVSGFMLIVLFLGRAWRGIDAFGGGDIKLMAVVGIFTGWKMIILAFCTGCILGAVIHSIRMKVTKEGNMLAFGPYLCAGTFLAVIRGQQFLQWYLGLF